jgi:PTS system galactitol-specific IIA component
MQEAGACNVAGSDAVMTVIPRGELSILSLDAHSDVEVLEALASRAEAAGWVRPTFREALLERERVFPTGLPTPIPVAIPHADVEHVIKQGLGVALLKRPVKFGELGGGDTSVEVQAAVLLLVTEPERQSELLMRLVNVFQLDDWLDTLRHASDASELAELFARVLAQGSE